MRHILAVLIALALFESAALGDTITRRDAAGVQYDVCSDVTCWYLTDQANAYGPGDGRLQLRELSYDGDLISAWPMGYHLRISESDTGPLFWVGQPTQGYESDRFGEVVLVDGVEVALARGESATGSVVEIRQSTILFGQTFAPLLLVESSYEYSSGVLHHTWSRTGLAHSCIWYEYDGMFGVQGADYDTVTVDGEQLGGYGLGPSPTVTHEYPDATVVEVSGNGPAVRMTADTPGDLLVYDHVTGRIVPYFTEHLGMFEVYLGDRVDFGYWLEILP